ncbi:MAG: DUF4394 domain-containing protein [Planctomycetota bacterium]
MKMQPTRPVRSSLIAAAAVTSLAVAGSADAELIYGLTTSNSIAVIDSTDPTASIGGATVTGLAQNDELQMLDYRAATDQLYAIGSLGNIYTVDATTFAATQVGPTLSPGLAGTSFAFDFNPAFDGGSGDPADIGRFARIISDTDNNRVIDGNIGGYLGTVEKTPVFYLAGDVNEGANPNIVGIAYTNSVPGATSTQQYGIDRATGSLVTVANNAGTLETVGTPGTLPIPTTNEAGFDISGDTGVAFAVLQTGPNSNLFTVDLTTGVFTPVGEFGSGDLIRDLAVVIPEPASLSLLALGGLALRRRR